MTNINNKLNRLVNTKNKLKNVINYSTPNIITEETSFKEYPKKIKKEFEKIVNNGTDELYNNLPKTTKEGTKITLNGETAQMGIVPKGNMDNFIRLPSEYTQVDYIEGHRAEYIDTGFKVTPKTKIEATFAFNQVTPVQQRIFGNGYSETDGLIFTTYINGAGNFAWACQNNVGNWQNTGIKADTNKHTFIVDSLNKIVTIDDRYSTTITTTRTNNSINTMLLFSYRGDGTTPDNFPYLKMYSTKIYNNNTLVRNFIPCFRNSDNKVGMYDIINNVFYTNQGTGAFTYGNIVEIFTPDHSQNIKIVTGEQNIEIKGKNLFDKNNANIVPCWVDYSSSISKNVIQGPSNNKTLYIECEPNTTYTVSRSILTSTFRTATYDSTPFPTFVDPNTHYDVSNFYKNDTATSITITTGENSKFLLVNYGRISDTNLEESLSTIQIEKGPKKTSYESYYQSQNYPINLGKNLFDVSNLSSQTNVGVTTTFDNSKIIFNGTSTAGVVVVKSDLGYKLKPGTYTFHFEDIGGNYQNPSDKDLAIFLTNSSSDTAFGNVNLRRTRPYITFTINEEIEIYLYMYINGEIVFDNWTIGFQIEKGSAPTSYVSYFEPIELCKIKDYQDYIYYNNEK